MMYPFCKYADETLVTFSNIIKNEDGEEVLYVHFERPMEYGFDTVIFQLPSYNIVKREGHFTDNEIAIFKTVVERGAGYFFDVARKEEIQSA